MLRIIKKILFVPLLAVTAQIFYFASASGLLAAGKAKFNVGIIKSLDLRQFNQTVLGIESNLDSERYKLHVVTINKDYNKKTAMAFLKENRISLLICLGERAAVYFTKWQNKIPVLFSMVLNYKRLKSLSKANVAGISMEISSQNLFAQFKLLYGGLKKLAIPYHPKASLETVNEAKSSATRFGIKLKEMSILSARKLAPRLKKRKSNFDSIWMISDFRLYNADSLKEVKDFFRFAKANKKPVFVSSDVFLKTGGLFSVSVDYLSLGSQLALLTNRALAGSEKLSKIKVVSPLGTRTVLNMEVARSLVEAGILEEEVLYEYEADVFYEPR